MMRPFAILLALALSFGAPARADEPRVAAALRAGDSAAAAQALIEAASDAASGVSGLSLSQDAGLRDALARELDFFAAPARRGAPPSFDIAQARQSELRSRRACTDAARLDEDVRVTASRRQTTVTAGAAIATCAFDTQTDDSYGWAGVAIRAQGAGGLRIRASFESRDADERRAAAQHLSAILLRLTSAMSGPAPARPPRRPRSPPPETTI